jgi:tRNA nucleotidyltransferase (CCA-adding enzyme)
MLADEECQRFHTNGSPMKYTPLSISFIAIIKTFLQQWQVMSLLRDLEERGAQIYLVGGSVRDLFLNLPIHEMDIEIHGMTLETVTAVLRKRGQVNLVGKSFGVLTIERIPIDWSLPRIDAAGRKPVVIIDPFLDITMALGRRDLTMNAMAINLSNFVVIDPFGGEQDIAERRLRTPHAERFVEDPLRFYRVMQFISRFGMMPDAELTDVCKRIDVRGVSRERIEGEMHKLLLKSVKPSAGLRWLDDIGRLSDIFPTLAALRNVPQDPTFHPEGDVFEHTMQTLDAAASICSSTQPITSFFVSLTEEEKIILLYAALCHDMGKAVTTKMIGGTWRSIGHEREGIDKARSFLKSIVGKKEIIRTVLYLVAYHMAPFQLVEQDASLAAYKRLAAKIAPSTNLWLLSMVALADRCGRNPSGFQVSVMKIPLIERFQEQAHAAGVLMRPEPPVLMGADLLDIVAPGPLLGMLIKRAYKIQIDKGIVDKAELKKRVLNDVMRAKV